MRSVKSPWEFGSAANNVFIRVKLILLFGRRPALFRMNIHYTHEKDGNTPLLNFLFLFLAQNRRRDLAQFRKPHLSPLRL